MISIDSGAYANAYAKRSPLTISTVYSQGGKRVFDLLITLLLTLFIFSWLVPVIALAIAVTSPGPIFFAQVRTGRNGRPFRYFKFRTTVCVQPGYRTNQPQETSTGRFLRIAHLNELPVFLNILMGDMSIVGPKPQTLQFDSQFWSMPGYRERHRVRPGLTGLVQTRHQPSYLPESFQHRHPIRYESWYVRRYSFWLDLRICWWTITEALIIRTKTVTSPI